MARELRVPLQVKQRGGWGPVRDAVVDSGAANAVIPNAEGPTTCEIAFADVLGDRLWGDVRAVELRVPGTTCRARVEAFVPQGIDPRPSNKWDQRRPSKLRALGRFTPILGHRFLEATAGIARFGKKESLTCDPRNADPMVSAFITEGPTMRFGVVCVRPNRRISRRR